VRSARFIGGRDGKKQPEKLLWLEKVLAAIKRFKEDYHGN